MSRKSFYFLGISGGLVLILASIIHTLNPATVEVKPWYGTVWKSTLANIMLGYFLFGATLVATLALLLEARSAWRMAKLQREKKRRERETEQVQIVRNLIATRRLDEASAKLRDLIADFPESNAVRVLLAQTLADNKQLEEALRVLNRGRITSKPTIELLMLTSKISRELGNNALAFDNLSLVLVEEPKCRVTLENLVEVSLALDRLEEATDFQARITKIAQGRDDYERQQTRLGQLQVQLTLAKKLPPGETKAALEQILKSHKNLEEALAALADLAIAEEDKDKGYKFFKLAYRQSGKAQYLEQLALNALRSAGPDTALALVSTAIDDARSAGRDVLPGRLFLIQLELYLEKISGALDELNSIDLELGSSEKYASERKLLRALVVRHQGDINESLIISLSLIKDLLRLPGITLGTAELQQRDVHVFKQTSANSSDGLLPQYSTP